MPLVILCLFSMLSKIRKSYLISAYFWVTLLVIALVFLLSAGYATATTTKDSLNSVVVIRTQQTVGSGFAIGEHLIITNYHVVSGYKTVNLVTYDDSDFMGQVIKVDEAIDLALIRVEEFSFLPLQLNMDELNPGDDVYAIGTPSNIPFTMTKGIISSFSRWIDGKEYIQIDASINSGNSGGPLLNVSGEVIGINTLKLQDAEGIGFALKSRYIDNFIRDADVEKVDPTQHQGQVSEEKKDNAVTEGQSDSVTNALKSQNETLLGVVILTSFLLLISFIFNIKQTFVSRRRKREYEFEIEIEEVDQIKQRR